MDISLSCKQPVPTENTVVGKLYIRLQSHEDIAGLLSFLFRETSPVMLRTDGLDRMFVNVKTGQCCQSHASDSWMPLEQVEPLYVRQAL